MLGVIVLVAAAFPAIYIYMWHWPADQWQVDVEVYREAGRSVLMGRPIYEYLTEPPQLLPFTYPPFAALLAIPLAWLPFGVVGWLWFWAQVLATAGIVWYAAYRIIHRNRRWRFLTVALLAAPMLWIQPVDEGLRFGQVNAFIVLACLMDLRAPRPRVLKHVPAGVLVGLAMAIKLTPGVFLIHYAINRRWRELFTAIGTAVAVTLGTFAILPSASIAFWGGAMSDPTRLGPNAGPSNQSIRGVLLRLTPEGTLQDVLWVILVIVIGVYGFGLARRAWLNGDTITEVAAVGLMACMLSPVAWVHHYHWMVVAFFALLGPYPRRDRARLIAAVALTIWFWLRLPWWGSALLNDAWPLRIIGHILTNGFFLGGLATFVLMRWAFTRSHLDQGQLDRVGSPDDAPAVPVQPR